MEKSGAACYVYAKISGMLKKAYVGKNAIRLFDADSLSSLWQMVFATPTPMIPEAMLATKLEKDAVNLLMKEYIKLLEIYDRPSRILVQLMHLYEIENIKTITAALSYGEQNHPHCVNIGNYATLHIDQWPDLKKITEGSEFSWIDSVPYGAQRQAMDHKLDLQGFRQLWSSLNSVKDESKSVLIDYFSREMAIINLIWALRLKVYYKYSDEKIIENLYHLADAPSPDDIICTYAYDILGRNIDSYDDWKDWAFSRCLNPHEEGSPWKVNPMWIEQRFRSLAVGKEIRLFHQYPMTDLSLVMFFRLKQQELNYIRAATEALRLGSDKTEAMYAAGISEQVGDV